MKQRSLKSRKKIKPANARVGFGTTGNAQSAVNGSLIRAIIGNYATNAHTEQGGKERGKWHSYVIIAGTLFYDMRGIFPTESIIVRGNAWREKRKPSAFTKCARFAEKSFPFTRL